MGILDAWMGGQANNQAPNNQPGGISTPEQDILMRIMQRGNARGIQGGMQGSQAMGSPLAQALSAQPEGLSQAGMNMMPPMPMQAPRAPINPLQGPGVPSPNLGMPRPMDGMEKSSLSNIPKDFSGFGLGAAAPELKNPPMPMPAPQANPADSSALSQIAGGMSGKLGSSFSAPSALPIAPQGMGGPGIREQLLRMIMQGGGAGIA